MGNKTRFFPEKNGMEKAMKNIVFYLGLATLFTHELDAMTHHEWRVLPLTSWLPDDIGQLTFLLAHIPLFAIVISLVASTNEKIRGLTQLGVGIFLVVHGILHALFMGHNNYEFTSLTSNSLIFGGAALGAVYLLFEYFSKTNQ